MGGDKSLQKVKGGSLGKVCHQICTHFFFYERRGAEWGIEVRLAFAGLGGAGETGGEREGREEILQQGTGRGQEERSGRYGVGADRGKDRGWEGREDDIREGAEAVQQPA